PPTANAGANQTIQLPASSVLLQGAVTVGGGGPVVTMLWTQTSGTAGVITTPSTINTTITGLTTVGIRVFRFSITDSLGSTAT
ncbi:PKD domain-containing protein, partial [Lacticaseibacillus paracasei]